MEKALKVINELKNKELIKNYALGGGIATIFYVEPIFTYDLDVLFIPAEEKQIITLTPIYEWLKKEKGCKPHKEHILIEGIPVQFIPVYNELIREAVDDSVEIKYGNTKTRVLKSEYLVAIMLQTFRPKDKERMIKLLDEAKINRPFLSKILQKHELKDKFNHFIKQYYEK